MKQPSILTPRLELVCVDAALVKLMGDNARLAEAVDARLAEDWPPEFWYEALPAMAAWIANHPEIGRGWGMWLMVVRADPLNGRRLVIGDLGFKGGPTAEGRVDVGYSVVASRQNRGYTSEAVSALCDWAFADERTKFIVGETFERIPASIRVLEKCGFAFAGTGTGREGDEGVLRYERHRVPK